MSITQKNWHIITAILIFVLALAFRINGLFDNHPFWVDEFSTANQAQILQKHGFEVFTNDKIFFETNKLTSAVAVMLGLNALGETTGAARLPFALIGSLIPLLLYFIMRYIGPKAAAIPTSLLAICSYLLITWSRQARSYAIQTTLIIGIFYVYFQIIDKGFTKKLTFAYVILAILGIYSHPFFYIVLASHLLFYVYTHFRRSTNFLSDLSKNAMYLWIVILGLGIFALYGAMSAAIKGGIVSGSNNLWLYHAYLWREYGLISFLGAIGLLYGLYKKPEYFTPIWLHIVGHLLFINFFFATATSRYVLPIFPWLLLGTGYFLTVSVQALVKDKKLSMALPLILVAGIIINGHKFDIKPNRFYSVNHDFREIALIDYDQIYNIVLSKGDIQNGNTAVIDTWADRGAWYVGLDYPALYNFRWVDEGVMKRTPSQLNEDGEKVLTGRESVRFISEVADLKKAMERYDTGFILIDDTSLPADVIAYAQENFTEEIFLDRYPLDDNPLSNWPVTLYSWGY